MQQITVKTNFPVQQFLKGILQIQMVLSKAIRYLKSNQNSWKAFNLWAVVDIFFFATSVPEFLFASRMTCSIVRSTLLEGSNDPASCSARLFKLALAPFRCVLRYVEQLACSTSINTGTPEHPGTTQKTRNTPQKARNTTRKPATLLRKPGTPPENQEHPPPKYQEKRKI